MGVRGVLLLVVELWGLGGLLVAAVPPPPLPIRPILLSVHPPPFPSLLLPPRPVTPLHYPLALSSQPALSGWLAGWLTGWLRDWLAAGVHLPLAGWLAGWLAPSRRLSSDSN